MDTSPNSFNIDYPGLPEGVTLHMAAGRFEMVRVNPNDNTRLIAWHAPSTFQWVTPQIINDDEEIKTCIGLENYAGSPCAMAVLLEKNTGNKAIIGIKTAQGAANESEPKSLRMLSAHPVLHTGGFPLTNLFNYLVAGTVVAELQPLHWLMIVVACPFVLLPIYIGFAGLVHNAFLGVVLMIAFPLLLAWLLLPKVMSFQNKVYNEQEARSLVRQVMRHLEEKGEIDAALKIASPEPAKTTQPAIEPGADTLTNGRL